MKSNNRRVLAVLTAMTLLSTALLVAAPNPNPPPATPSATAPGATMAAMVAQQPKNDIDDDGKFDGGSTKFAGNKKVELMELSLDSEALAILYGPKAKALTRTKAQELKAPHLGLVTGLGVKITADIENADDSKSYYWAQWVYDKKAWDGGQKAYIGQKPEPGKAGSPREMLDVPGPRPGFKLTAGSNARKGLINAGFIVENANGSATYNPVSKEYYELVQGVTRAANKGNTYKFSFASYLYYKDDTEKGHWDWSFTASYSGNPNNAPTVSDVKAKWIKKQ